MKSKYVLLTALSALVVGMGGANAADGLQVATKSYSDTHLASKDITAPTTDEKNKVVTVNGDATGFTYTTAPSAGNGISKSAANAFSVNAATNGGINVASGGVSVKTTTTSAVSVGASGVDVKVDGTTITKNATNGTLSAKQAEVFAGVNDISGDPAVEPGLVPGATPKLDYNKWMSSDGHWRYINGKNGVTGTQYNASTGAYEIGLNVRETSAIDPSTSNGVDVKVDGTTITKNATDGTLSATQTTYGAGNGVNLSGTTFAVKPYNGIDVTSNGVAVKAYNGINVDANGVAVKPKASTGAITVDGNGVAVNVDNSTIKVNANNKLEAQLMGGATASAAGKKGLVPAPASGDNTKFLRGDGTWGVPTDTDTDTTYNAGDGLILNGTTFSANFDTNTIGLVDKKLMAKTMTGASSGAAGTGGIVPAPGKGSEKSFLRGDGTWVIPTDKDTTYSDMTGATSLANGTGGLVPAPAAGKQTSFLRGDGTWAVPTDTNTTYNAGGGIVLSGTTFSAKVDAKTVVIPTTGDDAGKLTVPVMAKATSSAAGTAGLVPAPSTGQQYSFLRGDGTWVVPTNTTYSAGSGISKSSDDKFSVKVDNATIKVNSTSGNIEAQKMGAATADAAGTAGIVPAPAAGDQAKILSGAGTWVADNNTTYSAGNGVTLTDTTFAVKPYNGIAVSSSGVGVKAVANGGITVTSSGVSVDKNAVFGTTGCSNGQRCALTLELSSAGVPTYKWYPLTNPDGTLSN
ncbi:MAG: beta strand repeat-containing protein [Alphaproteobacteria bacterium]